MDDDELLETIVEANQPAAEVDDDVASEVRPVPIEEALSAVQILKEWVLQSPQEEPEFLRSLSKLASRLQIARVSGLQQSTMDRYLLAENA